MGALKIVTDNNELKEPKFNYKAELLKLVPNSDIVEDYIAVGKNKKRTPTKTGLTFFINECDRHNLSYELAMKIVIDKDWRGFTYSWLKPEDFEKYGILKSTEKPLTKKQSSTFFNKLEMQTKENLNLAFLDYMDSGETPKLSSDYFDLLVNENQIAVDEKTASYYDKKRSEAQKILYAKFPITGISDSEIKKNLDIHRVINNPKSGLVTDKTKAIVLLEYFDKKIKEGKTKIFDL